MQITIYNCLKQRLQTIDLQISEENTTWFDDDSDDHGIHMITDFDGGLLIGYRRTATICSLSYQRVRGKRNTGRNRDHCRVCRS